MMLQGNSKEFDRMDWLLKETEHDYKFMFSLVSCLEIETCLNA